MFIKKKRTINFFSSLLLLSILIVNIPIVQPLKYIIFIFILFCLITFSTKNNSYSLKFPFLLSVFVFLITCIMINFFPLKYTFKISSFDKINFDKISKKAEFFYKNEFINCIGNSNECYHPLVSKNK